MAKNQALIIVSATSATSLNAFLAWVCLLAPGVGADGAFRQSGLGIFFVGLRLSQPS